MAQSNVIMAFRKRLRQKGYVEMLEIDMYLFR